MKPTRFDNRRSYALPLPPVLLIGSVSALLFYTLILLGPLDNSLLRRYCLSHPVAIASVSLFFVGLTGLLIKWQQTVRQSKLAIRASASLRRLVTDGNEIAPDQRAHWLSASLDALEPSIQNSWFGLRVRRALELQIRRGRRNQLETDLKALSESDADQQHESLSLLRIIHWAMPMLGFLGTVLGISKTLGQLDTQKLATQQQEAMNELTAGLYVAFDTTAIALILTVISMFLQFAVSRMESNLLGRIDHETGDNLVGFLGVDPHDSHVALLTPVREMIGTLVQNVQGLVEEQASIWSRSIAESQRQWSQWTAKTCESAENELGKHIAAALSVHTDDLEAIHAESNRQAELRAKQWQTTLSDQARQLQSHQKEVRQQSETLKQLVESTSDLRRLEDTIADSISRLEDVKRLEEASMCIGEAVAMLATSLERAGVIRGAPLRPRKTRTTMPDHVADNDTEGQREAA